MGEAEMGGMGAPGHKGPGAWGKALEKSSKDKEKNSSDLGCKDRADKRKRSRVTDNVLTANGNSSSPSAAKR
ncbi:MRG-binding protein [Cricetulus griseus]|nr:MRG-binding protein [Cricetulus griseus]